VQDTNAVVQSTKTIVLTPFSDGTKPDAFRFMCGGVFLCLIAACAFLLYRPDPFAMRGATQIFSLGILVSLSAASTLFCRVELGEGQIILKGLLGKKTIVVSAIQSVRFQSAATFTQLVVRTQVDSVTFSSLSFSARQLNAIRNYCEQFRRTS
jgi:hypothetical protein